MKYFYKHTTMAKTKIRDNTKYNKVVELKTLICCLVGT